MSDFGFVKFYPGKFLEGTAYMSNEEAGAYMRLLCWQAQAGSLPDAFNRLARLAPGLTEEVWLGIADKFERDGNGKLRNPVMDTLRDEAVAASEAKRQAGRKGGLARASKHTSSSASTERQTDRQLDTQKEQGKASLECEQGTSEEEIAQWREAVCLGMTQVAAIALVRKMKERYGTANKVRIEWQDMVRRAKAARSPQAYFTSIARKEYGIH